MGAIARRSLKGYTYQQSVFTLFLAIMDTERSIAEVHSANQASRMAELKEWMARLTANSQYDDEQVRMAIEKITVLDAETIRIQFKYPGLVVDKKLIG